ncbi:MAG: AAA family ATPase [Acidobacteria bacterium]|nr:AAA family ATPase [Acidobacteriota bacterium]
MLAPDVKRLIYTLIKNTDPSLRSDFVDQKGGGCALLLHGEPGLGKTITAEAVAETLGRPLYTVTVGELGTHVEALEKSLSRALGIAERWNAVVLLDEADIFLEARSVDSVERNAMVSTFLRLLEYYNGVLILTTNRVHEIDPAILARISLPVLYPNFDTAAREQVIRNLMPVLGIELDDATIAKYAARNVNGRLIKNSLRSAAALARSVDASPAELAEMGHAILDRHEQFVAFLNARRDSPVPAAAAREASREPTGPFSTLA